MIQSFGIKKNVLLVALAKDNLTAVAIGIVSGMAAVGVNQFYMQLTAGKTT